MSKSNFDINVTDYFLSSFTLLKQLLIVLNLLISLSESDSHPQYLDITLWNHANMHFDNIDGKKENSFQFVLHDLQEQCGNPVKH